jgi:hypothetical protein
MDSFTANDNSALRHWIYAPFGPMSRQASGSMPSGDRLVQLNKVFANGRLQRWPGVSRMISLAPAKGHLFCPAG